MRSVMEQHEREFFVCQIRLGTLKVVDGIEIRPLTLEQELESNKVYQESYDDSLSCEIMTSEEIQGWMYENNLWTPDDEARITILEKDIESAKINIYESRKDKRSVALLKHELNKLKDELLEKLGDKNQYFHTTCEGIGESSKIEWIIANTTYKEDELYEFDDYSPEYITSQYYKSILSEEQIRDLVINEPWRSIWSIRENSKLELYKNIGKYELTHNQKHMIVWSQIYENLNESMEPPTEDVIKDHDMLDGWFIKQGQKRKKEQAEKELEENTQSDKIKNASEVFVMAKDKKDVDEIHSMNDAEGRAIKRQREALVKSKGTVEQGEFIDERIDRTSRQNQMYKDKFRK